MKASYRTKMMAVFTAVIVASTLAVPPALGGQHTCFGRPATIIGTSGSDRLMGTNQDDVIVGLDGADEIHGRGGNDLICAGGGGRFDFFDPTERVWGGDGNDRIDGGPGSERIYGGRGRDIILGGPGRDLLFGDFGPDRLMGGEGGDVINGGNGHDFLDGGRGADSMAGDAGDDRMWGGKGTDLADYYTKYFDRDGSSGETRSHVVVNLSRGFASGAGRDRLNGIENVFATPLDDRLIGDENANLMYGLSGDDVMKGRAGSDCLNPSTGANTVYGGDGVDYYSANVAGCGRNLFHGIVSHNVIDGVTVDLTDGVATYNNPTSGQDHESTLFSIEGAYGSSEEDLLIGDDGRNRLYGMGGNDNLEGRGGLDLLDGGFGTADSGDGGPGDDTCVRIELEMSCEG